MADRYAPATTGQPMTAAQRPRLCLLGGFSLTIGDHTVSLSLHLQRLLALLSLSEAALARRYVGGALWGDSTEQHAHGSLRSALWKLRDSSLDVVELVGDSMRLSAEVQVDVRRATRLAGALMRGHFDEEALQLLDPALLCELLPGWYDEWVLVERERHRQLSLHALEALCERLIDQSRFGPAVLAGLAAVSREPLRESGYRVLMKAHLAEGNSWEAIRSYEQYAAVAARELGIAPSPHMCSLVGQIVRTGSPASTRDHVTLTLR
jgi:DNA-binding SARP family transcriptional activator